MLTRNRGGRDCNNSSKCERSSRREFLKKLGALPVAAMAADTQAKITSGELEPFTGPITKQDGSEWLKEGEKADIGTMLGMNFYVQGVDDKLPQ